MRSVTKTARPAAAREPTPRGRLGFKEKRELGELPERIAALEAEKQRLYELMATPAFYATAGSEMAQVQQQLTTLEAELRAAYARWMELETLATSSEG